jgi:hypothetical protein
MRNPYNVEDSSCSFEKMFKKFEYANALRDYILSKCLDKSACMIDLEKELFEKT